MQMAARPVERGDSDQSRGHDGEVKASGDGTCVSEPAGSEARHNTVKSAPYLHLSLAISAQDFDHEKNGFDHGSSTFELS